MCVKYFSTCEGGRLVTCSRFSCNGMYLHNSAMMSFVFYNMIYTDFARFYRTNQTVDGQWSAWTPWGHCSVSCGAGLQSRYRFCSSPRPSGSGLPCTGPHHEDQVCIIAPCDRGLLFCPCVLTNSLSKREV